MICTVIAHTAESTDTHEAPLNISCWLPAWSATKRSGSNRSMTSAVITSAEAVVTVVVDYALCDDLGAMADRLLATAPAKFALAGHSMGGRVALEVMARAHRNA